jgi:transcription-repair coupling factor (superfamily II helicase)
MKGETLPRSIDTKLQLDFLVLQETEQSSELPGAFIPRRYMNESRWRIDGYRKVAELNSVEEVGALRTEWQDRYGPQPEPAELLLGLAELKLLAAERRVHLIEVQADKLVMRRGQDFLMVGGKFPRLTERLAKNKLGEIKKWLLALG